MNSRKFFVLFILIAFFTNNICYAAYFGECDAIETDSLRDELNRLCQQEFTSESNKIDLKKLIDSTWANIGMDDIINDGILGVKLSHPYVVDGAVEIIACGTGFNYL